MNKKYDFDKLPEQFVLKCTHDSGSVSICRNKSEFDIEKARTKIENLECVFEGKLNELKEQLNTYNKIIA